MLWEGAGELFLSPRVVWIKVSVSVFVLDKTERNIIIDKGQELLSTTTRTVGICFVTTEFSDNYGLTFGTRSSASHVLQTLQNKSIRYGISVPGEVPITLTRLELC